jgi:hypothetical protein
MPTNVKSKCDPRYGWEKGSQGKCKRVKPRAGSSSPSSKSVNSVANNLLTAGVFAASGASAYALVSKGAYKKLAIPSGVAIKEVEQVSPEEVELAIKKAKADGRRLGEGYFSTVYNTEDGRRVIKEGKTNVGVKAMAAVNSEAKGAYMFGASAESACSVLSSRLGIPLPKTVAGSSGNTVAQFQEKVRGREAEKIALNPKEGERVAASVGNSLRVSFREENLSSAFRSISLHPDLKKIAAFDAMVSNPDRHGGNLFFDAKANRWTGIDHGNAFATTVVSRKYLKYIKSKEFDTDIQDPAVRKGAQDFRQELERQLRTVSEKEMQSEFLSQAFAVSRKKGSREWETALARTTERIRENRSNLEEVLTELKKKDRTRTDSARCEKEYGWRKGGAGKCERVRPTILSGKSIAKAAGAGIISGVAAGALASGIVFASSKRDAYKRGFKHSFQLAKTLSRTIPPEKLSRKTEKAVFCVGGFGTKDAFSESRILAEKVSSAIGGNKKIQTLPVGYKDFNVSQLVADEEWGKAKKLDRGAIGKIKKGVKEAVGLFARTVDSGRNPEAVKLAAKLMSTMDANPNVEFQLVGHSGGGLIIQEVSEMLATAGKVIPTTAIGTPHVGVFSNVGNTETLISPKDPILKATSRTGVNPVSFGDVNGHGIEEYFASDSVKRKMAQRVSSPGLKLSPDQLRKDSAARAKCDERYGWTRGPNKKCVRIKSSKPSSRLSSPDLMKLKANPKAVGLLGIGVSTAAVSAGLAFTVGTVASDLSSSQASESEVGGFRFPPGGKPDRQTEKTYNSFKPGDLIAKSFTSKELGRRTHYAVYLGKDAKTGEHKIFHSTSSPTAKHVSVAMIDNPARLADENSSDYRALSPDEMKFPGRFTPEQIIQRAKELEGKTLDYRAFSSNCEHLARGIVEGIPWSEQESRVSGLTKKVASAVVIAGQSASGRGQYLFADKVTPSEAVRQLNKKYDIRSDSKEEEAAVLSEEVERFIEKRIKDIWLLSSDMTEKVRDSVRAATISEILVKSYILGYTSSQGSSNTRADSSRRRAKCDPKAGWTRGPGGKCVRSKPKETASEERPQTIRELRVVARDRGIIGYGSMTTAQLKSSIEMVDQDFDEAQKRRLVRTINTERGTAKRSVTAGFGKLSPRSPRERSAVKTAKNAAQEWKRLEALMTFAGSAPAKWGMAAAGAFLIGTGIRQWEIQKDSYRKGLVESAKTAQERVPFINVRPVTPAFQKGQTLPSLTARKNAPSNNITFAVGSALKSDKNEPADGTANSIIESLRSLSSGEKATEGDKWLSGHTMIPFDMKESGVPSYSGKSKKGRAAHVAINGFGAALKNKMRGRNQDAVDLAANLFAYAREYPNKRINIVAHSTGGMATKEALEIISKMEVKSDKKHKAMAGKDVVKRFNVVLMGTPHFGYTENVSPNMRTITSAQDPLSILPSQSSGARHQWISSVKGHGSKQYLSDPYVRESMREAFGYYRADSMDFAAETKEAEEFSVEIVGA